MEYLKILQQCTVANNVVKLPEGQLDRKLYQEVAKALELIGGKWKGGKVMGFVFTTDPTESLGQISGGEKRNLKKEYQFFGTQPELADYIIDLAGISPKHSILEPEAGQGALIEAVSRSLDSHKIVDYFELMPTNQTILDQKDLCAKFVAGDFLEYEGQYKWDRIIANPPFSKNQDIDHIRKMFDVCKERGRIVTVASTHWKTCDNKKEKEFREWLLDINAWVTEVPAGVFKKSGTMVETCIIVINKM